MDGAYCFCHCKDTNSKAIHNVLSRTPIPITIVFATAKILIRKQFTTGKRVREAVSNCFCHCKDTNSKAIHNEFDVRRCMAEIVFATAKILIRKQFTTGVISFALPGALFLPLQRY